MHICIDFVSSIYSAVCISYHPDLDKIYFYLDYYHQKVCPGYKAVNQIIHGAMNERTYAIPA